MKHCVPRRIERGKQRRAAAGIEMGGDLVEQQERGDAGGRAWSAAHGRGSARSAAPSARRWSRAPPACPFARAAPRDRPGAGRSACGRRRDPARARRPRVSRSSASRPEALCASWRSTNSGVSASGAARKLAASTPAVLSAWRSARLSVREKCSAAPAAAICASTASIQQRIGILLEQAVALAHGLVEIGNGGGVAGDQRRHQPVEETAAVAGRAGEQAIHGGVSQSTRR